MVRLLHTPTGTILIPPKGYIKDQDFTRIVGPLRETLKTRKLTPEELIAVRLRRKGTPLIF